MNESTHLYKTLASLLAIKWDHPYSSTMPSYAALWLSPCYALPSTVSEVPIPVVDRRTSHHLP